MYCWREELHYQASQAREKLRIESFYDQSSRTSKSGEYFIALRTLRATKGQLSEGGDRDQHTGDHNFQYFVALQKKSREQIFKSVNEAKSTIDASPRPSSSVQTSLPMGLPCSFRFPVVHFCFGRSWLSTCNTGPLLERFPVEFVLIFAQQSTSHITWSLYKHPGAPSLTTTIASSSFPCRRREGTPPSVNGATNKIRCSQLSSVSKKRDKSQDELTKKCIKVEIVCKNCCRRG